MKNISKINLSVGVFEKSDVGYECTCDGCDKVIQEGDVGILLRSIQDDADGSVEPALCRGCVMEIGALSTVLRTYELGMGKGTPKS